MDKLEHVREKLEDLARHTTEAGAKVITIQCLSLLDEYQKESGWRSMDSAPRDGTDILAFDGERDVNILRWLTKEQARKTGREGWHEPYTLACTFAATAWQPLPTPPQEES